MRNRKSLQALGAKKATVIQDIEPKRLTEIEKRLDQMSEAISSMEAEGKDTGALKNMVDAVRESARRPSQIGCRVFYDGEGKCSAMVCTTDPAEIAQIEKTNVKPH